MTLSVFVDYVPVNAERVRASAKSINTSELVFPFFEGFSVSFSRCLVKVKNCSFSILERLEFLKRENVPSNCCSFCHLVIYKDIKDLKGSKVRA